MFPHGPFVGLPLCLCASPNSVEDNCRLRYHALKLGAVRYRVKFKFSKTGFCMQKKLWQTVSTQKTIIQTDHPSLRYKPKHDGLVWRKPNRHVFAHLSNRARGLQMIYRFLCRNRVPYIVLLHTKTHMFKTTVAARVF